MLKTDPNYGMLKLVQQIAKDVIPEKEPVFDDEEFEVKAVEKNMKMKISINLLLVKKIN